MEPQNKAQIAKSVLGKMRTEGVSFSDFKIYYKATVIKIAQRHKINKSH